MLTLSNQQDAYGFIKGSAIDGSGMQHDVSVMPPLSEWSGKIRLANYEPDSDDFIVFVDDEEIGRAETLGEAEAMIGAILQ